MRGAFWLFAAPLVAAFESQTPWEPTSTTLVDLLSADRDYTTLLKLLQRARLIPTLNRLNGTTFFAPTNDAINRYILWNTLPPLPLGGPQQDEPTWSHGFDNVNEQLRQQLLYHLLNYTLPHYPPEAVEVLTTLHFPRIPLEPPSKEPPPDPPWLPTPGGSLNGEGQRLRLAVRDGKAFINVDAMENRESK
jgi:solute carrier family 25 carnitine/acylcarnitine transporter 20/29